MAPKKSIFRQPGSQHFQLVHRSQRDPLFHDSEASQQVLKAYERGNDKKGKSRAELEQGINPSELAHDLQRTNIGEAAAYGVYFDDTNYDYMQHLKEVGKHEDGVDSFLIEAQATSSKGKGKAKDPIVLRDLPPEVLPSATELPRNYESQEAIPSSIAGFQPDMDPHLRQALEALEDDAFVDDGLEDNFFGELVHEGERGAEEDFDFDFEEDGILDGDTFASSSSAPPDESAENDEDSLGWEARFAAFKRAQKADVVLDGRSDDDEHSEGGDTIGRLPEITVIGGKRRRKGTSDASGYSMSSASLYRSEGLQTLDDRFDQIEREYAEDEDGEDEELEDDDEAPDLITSREDFEQMMDQFLDNYEILGGKMKPKLDGDSAAEKLDTLRRAMRQGDNIRVRDADDDNDHDILVPVDIDDVKDRWDCETILSTYSNLENHPRLIRARNTTSVPRIRIDPRTGLPSVEEASRGADSQIRSAPKNLDEEPEDLAKPQRTTISRPRNESKEDKKARKQTAKVERQARRVEKKQNTDTFDAEFKRQSQSLAAKQAAKVRRL